MKLLIVDDEERTRNLLRKHIKWEEIGILEVETARNGQDALSVSGDFRPDIVLCDVRMPKMDGIEFAKRLRWTDTSCKIIFLSGFSDKDYLLSAIHLKATSYIEKPINLQEVRKAVEAAVQLRVEEKGKEQAEHELQAGYERSLPFLKQDLVRRLISDVTAADTALMLRNQRTLPFKTESMFTVATVPLNKSTSQLMKEDPSFIQEALLHKLNENPILRTLGALCGFDSYQRLVILLPGSFGSSYRESRQTIEQLCIQLREIDENTEFRLSVGEPVSGLEQVPHAYRSACDAGNLHFYIDGRTLLFADSLGGNSLLEADANRMRIFRDALRKGNVAHAHTVILEWTELARRKQDLDIVRVKDTYFQFLLVAMEVADQQGMTEQTEDAERKYVWKEIDRIASLTNLEEYVLFFLEPFRSEPEEGRDLSSKMREIIRYIHGHFHEKGFNIQAIADHVNLSETYLCSYFKKQKEQTVKEFITEVRTEKAMELLRDHELKLYDIAARLGFADANYFTTFFKKYAGCTPSEYRERMAK